MLSTYFWQLPHPLKIESFLPSNIPKKLNGAAHTRACSSTRGDQSYNTYSAEMLRQSVGFAGIPKRKSTGNGKLDIPKALPTNRKVASLNSDCTRVITRRRFKGNSLSLSLFLFLSLSLSLSAFDSGYVAISRNGSCIIRNSGSSHTCRSEVLSIPRRVPRLKNNCQAEKKVKRDKKISLFLSLSLSHVRVIIIEKKNEISWPTIKLMNINALSIRSRLLWWTMGGCHAKWGGPFSVNRGKLGSLPLNCVFSINSKWQSGYQRSSRTLLFAKKSFFFLFFSIKMDKSSFYSISDH